MLNPSSSPAKNTRGDRSRHEGVIDRVPFGRGDGAEFWRIESQSRQACNYRARKVTPRCSSASIFATSPGGVVLLSLTRTSADRHVAK